MKKKIVVIGSGFGGLGAAARLAGKGHDVEIFEKRDQLGGRAYQYQINGFKFDGGPTVITAPYIFDEIFDSCGKKRDDYFKLVPLDPFYRLFNHEGRYFDYRHKREDMLAEIEKWSPADVKGYVKFEKKTKHLFDFLHQYTDKPFHNLSDMLKIVPGIIKRQGYLDAYNFASLSIKDEFLRRCFSFHPLLIGGSPLNTPSLYTLIIQFEKEWGVHYALGGTGAIVEGLGKLFTDMGGKVNLETEVEEILIKNGRANGVKLKNGEKVDADAVVCNGDLSFAYKHLIANEHRRKFTDKKIDSMHYSTSLFVIYFGTKKRYLDSKLHHHNIILNERYKGLLKDIFKPRQMPDDFSLYLHMPTLTDPSIAPAGHESFYVLSLVPNLDISVDWKHYAKPYRDKIIQFLEENYLPDLNANIVAEHYIDPLHFQNTLNSHKGAAFALQPRLTQSAFLRPHNQSEEFENLYFVGAGTHPGAGVPAVLSSGKIAAELIDPSSKAA